MNDKQQLAAMGEHLAEQQPLCMAKRIEELEAQLEKLTNRLAWRNTGSPNGLRRFMTQKQYKAQTPGIQKWYEPNRYEVPEGWQLVPVEVTLPMQHAYFGVIDKNMQRVETDCRFGRYDSAKEAYRAMLAAAPSPDGTK